MGHALPTSKSSPCKEAIVLPAVDTVEPRIRPASWAHVVWSEPSCLRFARSRPNATMPTRPGWLAFADDGRPKAWSVLGYRPQVDLFGYSQGALLSYGSAED